MNRSRFVALFVVGALALSCVPLCAAELKPIQLPAPRMEGGMPLMQALNARQSQRAYSDRELPLQVLSDMLWAAFGVNRPDSGKRTAPSAGNWQEIDIYVTMASGVYRYNAATNTLEPVIAQDVRSATGRQPFVPVAPVNLVFVADYGKMGHDTPEDVKKFYSAADTGYISQNVYLFCASEGLATVVRGMVDRDKLAPILKLGENQRVVFAQTVGYPAK